MPFRGVFQGDPHFKMERPENRTFDGLAGLYLYCSNNFKLTPKVVKAVLNVCEVYGLVMFES